ncbi:hypothetical protein PGT21_012031 [Puccinia graminis f. sp. tritici]|uniref:Uncharacterized protein n=1 Tax=Puccinia graminis f. sp. tritici TaxID=56615 RepID=A0A5B0MIR9_PUCGR|nr:hypothetical protein PGT21_011014 [Puccinia graminis f. sp. tritici]KAA1076571.1 hypothetical protein PGT21_012031 [Puccinia graminis f. sp. tritici]
MIVKLTVVRLARSSLLTGGPPIIPYEPLLNGLLLRFESNSTYFRERAPAPLIGEIRNGVLKQEASQAPDIIAKLLIPKIHILQNPAPPFSSTFYSERNRE